MSKVWVGIMLFVSTLGYLHYQFLMMNQDLVDSLLTFKSLNNESLTAISNKISLMTQQSGEVEKSVDALASETPSGSQSK